jgi:hypothetical protein
MEKQVNTQSTFAIAELEQRLEMAQCPPGTVDLLEWISADLKGILCWNPAKSCG